MPAMSGGLVPTERARKKKLKVEVRKITILALAELEDIYTIDELQRAAGYRTRDEHYFGKRRP